MHDSRETQWFLVEGAKNRPIFHNYPQTFTSRTEEGDEEGLGKSPLYILPQVPLVRVRRGKNVQIRRPRSEQVLTHLHPPPPSSHSQTLFMYSSNGKILSGDSSARGKAGKFMSSLADSHIAFALVQRRDSTYRITPALCVFFYMIMQCIFFWMKS